MELSNEPCTLPHPASTMAEWKLIYWYFTPGVGRGEFVRLMFEEAGVPYDDVCRNTKDNATVMKYYKGEESGYPVQFPPIIKKGDFVLSQTPAIMEYLGKKFGLFPDGGPEDEAHAMQINLSVADCLAECMNAFHPLGGHASYTTQIEEAKPYIEKFRAERLPKFLEFYERALNYNNDGKGFIIGEKITYVDLVVYNILRGAEFQFPDDYKSLPIPSLRAFKQRLEERPNIAAYLKSDRCAPFSDSMS